MRLGEGLSPISGDVIYEFTILYLGENIPDDGSTDMSHLFTNFYSNWIFDDPSITCVL